MNSHELAFDRSLMKHWGQRSSDARWRKFNVKSAGHCDGALDLPDGIAWQSLANHSGACVKHHSNHFPMHILCLVIAADSSSGRR